MPVKRRLLKPDAEFAQHPGCRWQPAAANDPKCCCLLIVLRLVHTEPDLEEGDSTYSDRETIPAG